MAIKLSQLQTVSPPDLDISTDYLLVTESTSNTSRKTTLSSIKQVIVDPSIQALGSSLSSHTNNTSNPHSVTKSQVGLGSVDNTSDANKPISTATQSALDNKANTAALDDKLAKADYTATDVLAKLLTVDTDTAGINATTLRSLTLANLIPGAMWETNVYHATPVVSFVIANTATMYFTPIWVPPGALPNRISIDARASGNVRAAVYTVNATTMNPETLVEGSATTGSGGSTIVEWTISALPAGFYWLAAQANAINVLGSTTPLLLNAMLGGSTTAFGTTSLASSVGIGTAWPSTIDTGTLTRGTATSVMAALRRV